MKGTVCPHLFRCPLPSFFGLPRVTVSSFLSFPHTSETREIGSNKMCLQVKERRRKKKKCNYVTTFRFETSASFHVTVPPQVESDFTSCCCCCWLRLSRPWVATSLLAGRPGGKTPATLQREWGCPKEEKPVPLCCSAKNEDVQMASAAGFCGRADCKASRSRFGISFGKGDAVPFVPTCTRFGFLFMIKS